MDFPNILRISVPYVDLRGREACSMTDHAWLYCYQESCVNTQSHMHIHTKCSYTDVSTATENEVQSQSWMTSS
jgi:CDP-diacylglycerol pyrophosphatase